MNTFYITTIQMKTFWTALESTVHVLLQSHGCPTHSFLTPRENHGNIPANSASEAHESNGRTSREASSGSVGAFTFWVTASRLTYVQNPVSRPVPPPALQLLVLGVLQSPVMEHDPEYALKEGQCQSTHAGKPVQTKKTSRVNAG